MVAAPWPGKDARECATLTDLLRNGRDADVPPEIEIYLEGGNLGCPCDAAAANLEQRAFVVMCALDDAAMDIHPAMPTRLGGASVSVNAMLAQMKQARTARGEYGEHQGRRTLPKGRLAARRETPEAVAASGANLETQFDYLTVLEPLPERFVVEIEVVPPRRSPLPNPPSRIGLAPIAEDADDLAFTAAVRRQRPFLDAQPRDPQQLRLRTTAAVEALLDRGADLIVLPELAIPKDAPSALALALRARPPQDGLIVCGSALTEDVSENGLHFNEAVVLDARGRVLLRQRKVHPFNMGVQRMRDCGVPFAAGYENSPHMEDIEPHSVVRICDLHGAGRLMVSICEDLEQETPGGVVARAVRPDWMITPVLDVGQTLGRWTHQRAIEIARRTGSQVVVSCSATLTVRDKGWASLDKAPAGGLGLGLLYEGERRRVRIVDASEDTSSPRALVVDWDPDSWNEDEVGARMPRRR
ncbi:MAG: hypothetical protein H2038_09105 [Brevundimonas sp.]|uniref:nitrilase-related carbon-nitrogen hydrolase n=1 Tax=Brevundimonas sp. TaxID=1871086 RepID=UPI0017BD8944|nr:nitrilase-related carbon-nitrogen hydrolase [Brevundimonas sp.]MBA4804792.1 hypothetical protein [Brevundimonas sp.]